MQPMIPTILIAILVVHASFTTMQHLKLPQNNSPPAEAIVEIAVSAIVGLLALVYLPEYVDVNTEKLVSKLKFDSIPIPRLVNNRNSVIFGA